MKWLYGYYAVINIILFLVMLWDKLAATKARRRVPEANLFVMALLGGGIGGILAMLLGHHKTRKPQFWIIFVLAVILHGTFLYLWFGK
ncbi:MAG: DUF1294 domain-containing protein [Clostridia bacterium]|jgi:uncharacterized membrane protein YsdA (DUF1294 family)|nr:DUF1294 domain-containing protein [Clostridia bacterium]